jgi:hypothetical protein
MSKKFYLKKGEHLNRDSNKRVIRITETSKGTYLWIGNDDENDKFCFATLSGKATLLKLANQIIESVEGWKSIPETKKPGKKNKRRAKVLHKWPHRD